MAVSRANIGVVTEMAALVFAIALPAVRAQALAPAPASDGPAIDQGGIAYVLMLAALVLTYLIHPMAATPPYELF